jgi:hypothetical protein
MHNMVTFYGAGMRTAVLNVENKLSKILGKQANVLVVRASERNEVLAQISARAAKVQRWDPESADELMQLRKQVKEIFDKGLNPGDELMEQMWFLDPKSRDVVEKLTRQYAEVVTPNDFAVIGKLMSEHMEAQVPILGDFTRFFGRLAEDYLVNAKPPSTSLKRGVDWDWQQAIKEETIGERKKNPPKLFNRLPGYNPNDPWVDVVFGIKDRKYPKKWTQIPWVNFDGKVLEQYYTQRFEEKLVYKTADGTWITNIIQVDQKTDPSWLDEIKNKSGQINDVADATGARTAFAVNGNHSNDATLVKNFHLWGKKNNVGTSTIHDAFFSNAADMINAKSALRVMYADAVDRQSVKQTLDLMRSRGLPKDLYDKYLAEAIDKGIIPVAGKSRVGGKLLTEEDILKRSDITKPIPIGFKDDLGFYGLGG